MGQVLDGDQSGPISGMPVRAAQYVRMSTEHQKYSTENQSEAIQNYAARRGIEIVRTYADEGKSGLSLGGRDALKRLIDDVQAKRTDFTTILVYDISRWGRFQDADESAYYEYICKRSGISVQYCAEQFENDGSPVSTIVKGVKRAMAGEYSRELSVKVFAGQSRLIERGYRQGGPAGYGLRRNLVDQAGASKGELSRGEHKSIQTDRVVLIPGPREEIDTVRWIYTSFVNERRIEREIADALNERGITTDLGRCWTRGTVHQVLINEKYIGNNVWNRGSFKLKKKRVRNSGTVEQDPATELLNVNGEFTASIVVVRCRTTTAGSLRWRIRFDFGLWPDITVAVRMDGLNQNHLDYYLLPRIDMTAARLQLAEDNGISLDAYRFPTLEAFFALAARVSLREVA